MKKKIFTILGALAGIVLIISVLGNILGGNDVRPRLETVILTNQEVTQLSKIARAEATSFDLQSIAATIDVVAASDNVQLSEYFEANHGRAPVLEREDSAAAVLSATDAGPQLDSAYITAVRGDIEFNLAAMADLRQSESGTDLAPLLDQIIANYNAHLEAIESYESTD